MNHKLPDGWATVCIRDVVSTRKGKKPAVLRCSLGSGFVPYLDIHAIESGEVRSYAESATSRLGTSKDVLIVWDGARSGWVGLGRKGAIGSTIMALQPKTGDRIFLYRWLQSQFQHINTNTRGTGIPHVDPEVLWNLEIPFPPLPEQRRIVAKLEKLLEKVDACRKRLDRIPTILKRFRQSVLAAACSGRLTQDWREENATDRDSCSHATSLAREEMRRPFDKTQGRQSAVATEDSELPDIPENWRWIKLPDTGDMNRGKSRHRPRNEPSLFSGRYPFIQTGDIAQSGGRITTHKQTYNETGLAQSRLWPAGTVCITIAANIAESAILTYPACFPDSVVGIIADPKVSVPEYLEFFMRVAKSDLATFAPATAQKNINIGILNEVQVPLPPLPEQQEIVRRVESLFALADRIEARTTKARKQADSLTPSLLARAFRGELVPQDPNDEPAENLLERIKTSSKEL